MPHRNALELVEQTFGPLAPETIVAARSATAEQLAHFKRQYEALAQILRVPARPPGELRPIVSSAYIGRRASGLAVHTDDDLRQLANVEAAADRIHLHLMYSHGIAIPDPLRYLADDLPDEDTQDVLPSLRLKLEHYLIFLSYLRPLVDRDVVLLLEDDLFVPEGDARRLLNVVDDLKPEDDLMDFVAERRGMYGPAALQEAALLLSEHRRFFERFVTNAVDALMASIELSARHGHSLDVFLPYRFYLKVLQRIASAPPEVFEGWRSYRSTTARWSASFPQFRPDESLLVGELARLQIPDFFLTAKDVLAVRNGSEFQAWRSELQTALREVEDLRSREELMSGSAERVVSDRLAAGRAHLEAQIGKSAFLSRARSGMKSFAIGSLAALGTSPFLPPGQPIERAAAVGAVTVAWDAWSSRAERSSSALLQHYLQLSPVSDTAW